MKELDYGKGYRYAHDEAGGFAAGERYWPDDMEPPRFYEPVAARPRDPHRRAAGRAAPAEREAAPTAGARADAARRRGRTNPARGPHAAPQGRLPDLRTAAGTRRRWQRSACETGGLARLIAA